MKRPARRSDPTGHHERGIRTEGRKDRYDSNRQWTRLSPPKSFDRAHAEVLALQSLKTLSGFKKPAPPLKDGFCCSERRPLFSRRSPRKCVRRYEKDDGNFVFLVPLICGTKHKKSSSKTRRCLIVSLCLATETYVVVEVEKVEPALDVFASLG